MKLKKDFDFKKYDTEDEPVHKYVENYTEFEELSQVSFFIRDKYCLPGLNLYELYGCEFIARFLRYHKDQKEGNYERQKSVIISNKLPKTVLDTIKKTEKDPTPHSFKGYSFFLPLFENEEAIRAFNKLNDESTKNLELFLIELFALPENLSTLYTSAYTNEYRIAKEHKEAMEALLLVIEKSTDSFSHCVPFVFDGVEDEKNIIPENKINLKTHTEFVKQLENYYLELNKKLPIIRNNTRPLSEEEIVLIERTNHKATIPSFWARYMKDIFEKNYKKPHLKEISIFINALFDTNYIDSDIANLTRSNV